MRASIFRHIAVLLLSTCGVAQETHFQANVNSSGSVFEVDLSGVKSTVGATVSIRNNTGDPVTMPWVGSAGTMPPLSEQSVVASLQQSATTDRGFAISAWKYVIAHTYGYCSAGSSYDPSGYAADPTRILYGYGMGCCGQQAELLAGLWSAAGYPTHLAEMTFHTVPEIYYGGAWHLLDPNHRVIYYNPDGTIASVAQIIADPTIVANTANAEGDDPIGWSAATMAQLYASNASSLHYVGGPWPQLSSELTMLPLETLELRSDDPWPNPPIYQQLNASETPLGPSSFGTAVLRRWLPYSDPEWLSRTQANQGVTLATAPDGRQTLVASGNSGYVVYSESTPFPILSLQLKGEFFRNDPSATIVAYFSADGSTWSNGVAVPLPDTTSSSEVAVDFSQLARGAYTYFLMLQFSGPTPGDVGAFALSTRSEGQMAPEMFPSLAAGSVNALEYSDLSPASQPRQISIEVTIREGWPALQGLTAESEIPEDPTYSIAPNYEASRLVDGDTSTLAYPGSTQLDYLIHLSSKSHISQVSIWWGMFGTSPAYVTEWNLYGRLSPTEPWQRIASGGPPGCAVCDITVNTMALDLRLTAAGNNWIGAYEVKAYGNELVPIQTNSSRTVYSVVPEDPTYSIASGYGAANLIDGNLMTLAYPGSRTIDYVVGLGALSHVSFAAIQWGYFGLSSTYVSNWTLESNPGNGEWTQVAGGGVPGADASFVPLNIFATNLQLLASSTMNWIGAYELSIAATQVIEPSVVFSNVPDGGYGYPPANLVDGNDQTLAYPGSPFVDYEMDFGVNTFIDFLNVTWGYFGSNPIYVQSWVIYGQRDGDLGWTPIARGGFPGSTSTSIPIERTFRRLRVTAASTAGNWIGIFEVQPWAEVPINTNP